MRRYLLLVAGVILAALGIWLLVYYLSHRNLEPLITAAQEGSTPPGDTIVINADDALTILEPFALHEEIAAARGLALVLPEGKGSTKKDGMAGFTFRVPRGGKYEAWARVRWRDSCGNSITIRVNDCPKQMLGGDHVYGTWHWVTAGQYLLEDTLQRVTILEREDGIAMDQIIFTPDQKFLPGGPVLPGGKGTGVRLFSDNFARSPGHGMEAWDILSGKWEIMFSLDPNRIPNQYSLLAKPEGETKAVALVKGPPWKGCRLAFSALPLREGCFGAVLERTRHDDRALHVSIKLANGGATLRVTGAGNEIPCDLGETVRLNQWHRFVIERWAYVLRVTIDGRAVVNHFDLGLKAGDVGLFVADGEMIFDDVAVEEMPWQLDDGKEFRMPWVLGERARWYRQNLPDKPKTLVGRRGRITARWGGMSVEEILIDKNSNCIVETAGLSEVPNQQRFRVFRRTEGVEPPRSATLSVGGKSTLVPTVAVRYGKRLVDTFRIGPYHFTKSRIEDPSDYLDFTPEEIRKMKASPEYAEKLKRRKKFIPLVGRRGSRSVWARERGRWSISNGLLVGNGPDAVLSYSQDIVSSLGILLRIKLGSADSAAEIELFSGPEPGIRVGARGTEYQPKTKNKNALVLHVPADEKWHDLRIHAKSEILEAKLDNETAGTISIKKGDGGRILLKVPAGRVYFDDIEFAIQREGRNEFFYGFDRRETDWWRSGRWVDHGGIACAQASNWVSLVAPEGERTLWNKRLFGSDVLVGFNVEENTEWFGWTKNPGHTHYPFDNIRVILTSKEKPDTGYKLEVNSRDHSATVLYRNGKEVACVAQDGSFPMRYRGGHAPYAPRRNRISLVKRGGLLRVIVNGREVLTFTDSEPIPVSRVGIGGYNTRINFSYIEVRDAISDNESITGE